MEQLKCWGQVLASESKEHRAERGMPLGSQPSQQEGSHFNSTFSERNDAAYYGSSGKGAWGLLSALS